MPTASSGLTADEQVLYDLINDARADRGLGPLVLNPMLVSLARQKAQDIRDNHYFSHRSPTLGSHKDMVRAMGVPSRAIGENLMKSRSASWAHSRILASDGYNDNIFLPFYTDVGVGVVDTELGIVVCELFAQI